MKIMKVAELKTMRWRR